MIPAVIVAGGKGTRLGLSDIPKPMARINGMPILEHQIRTMRAYGITEFYLLCGYMWEKINEYFKDGEWLGLGISIKYIIEDKPLGTAGSIKQLDGILDGRFLLCYGDIMFNMDIEKLLLFDKPDSIATIVAHPNNHPYDSDLIEVDKNKLVTKFHTKPHDPHKFYKNMVNSGIYIFSPEIFSYITPGISSDICKNILPNVLDKKVYAYITPEYIKDMGTPDRLNEAKESLLSGKMVRRNLQYMKKAIFLDRDGVINKFVDNLSDIDKFELLPGVAEAIRKINQSDYLAIVVTNQPMIAKGFITDHYLNKIHAKMEHLLGLEHAYLDATYYCPHHPDKGFMWEVPELKINCNCRKPKPGMLLQAQEDFNIHMSKSYMIGDSDRDIKAGCAAGCRAILIKDRSLLSVIESIL